MSIQCGRFLRCYRNRRSRISFNKAADGKIGVWRAVGNTGGLKDERTVGKLGEVYVEEFIGLTVAIEKNLLGSIGTVSTSEMENRECMYRE